MQERTIALEPVAVGRFDRVADRVAAIAGGACEVLIVVMIAVVVAEVTLRDTLGVSLELADELGGYLLVALAFLSFSVTAREGGLLAVEAIIDRLAERRRTALMFAYSILGLGLTLVSAWFLGRYVWSTFTRDMVSMTWLQVPLWLPQVVMPLGMVLLAIVMAADCAQYARKLSQPLPAAATPK